MFSDHKKIVSVMEKKRLGLPAGIQTFEKLHERNCVYVDKTNYLVNLIDNFDACFLARPRRFGKSLTVSTFDALFSGKRELFKGLYAEAFLNRPDFKPYPVIRLDMSNLTTSQGIEIMELELRSNILDIAKKLNVDILDKISSGQMFDQLIRDAARKYNSKVVVLIDEYDKPYTDFVNEPEIANNVRTFLRDFYARIKANDEYIRFTFITGISKFAKLGVFSTLNNLRDISLMPEYGEICGYTEAEIIDYFPDYIEETACSMQMTTDELIAKMRYYYNGFSFDRKAAARLYNPFSTLLFFSEKEFFKFWIDTGSSKMIADYMKNNNLTVEQFRNFPVSIDFARNPGDVDTAPPEGFLYQAGYLTLRPGISEVLSLDYPNTEVLTAMSGLLTQNILDKQANSIQNYMMLALSKVTVDLFIDALNALLASIPYDDFEDAARQNVLLHGYKFPVQEWLYRSTILAFMRGCGVVVAAEMHTSLGRADLVVSHKGKTWVIELKVAYKGESPKQKAEEALQQITDKNYAKSYPDAVCIGLAIDDSRRQITNYEVAINN